MRILLLLAITLVAFATQTFAIDSLCDKYTAALNPTNPNASQDPLLEFALVRAIVERAVFGNTSVTPPVDGLVVNKVLAPFFISTTGGAYADVNGRAPGDPACTPDAEGYSEALATPDCQTPNFATNEAARNTLTEHLVQFFGSSGALNCTARDFPQYAGVASMNVVHRRMGITPGVFALFNGAVANSALSFGVDPRDVAVVGQVLASFGRDTRSGSAAVNSICSEPGCPCVDGAAGDECGQDVSDSPIDPIVGGQNSGIQSATLSFSLLAMAALMAIMSIKL